MSYKPSGELASLIDKLLGAEKNLFFESLGEQLPHTIRFNTLMGETETLAGFLREQRFDFEPFPGLPDVFRLLVQPYPIGKSLSHYLGHFYVQDVASMIPPRVLNPQPGERILDMSAAPGSKTTQMAVMMQNRGLILANDVVQKRLRALMSNLQRLGVLNTAVVKNYGESFGNQYFEIFDRILLDPACSGLGTLHKSPEVLSWWTGAHCERLASGQKQLLKSAIKAVKPGGTIVYSTCTLTAEENEAVIDFALNNYPVELEQIELPGLTTRPGLQEFAGQRFHPGLNRAVRLYPFENATEGFFVARLRKTGKLDERSTRRQRKPLQFDFLTHQTSPVKKYLDYLAGHFGVDRAFFKKYRYRLSKTLSLVSPTLAEFSFKSVPLYSGLTIGRPLTQAAKLTTEGSQFLAKMATANHYRLRDLESLHRFVNRNSLPLQPKVHAQVVVSYHNIPIGYGLADGDLLKSQFPKAEWPFQIVEEDF